MISLFKKYKIREEPYEYNTDVPFEIAFKALKEGYIIKHSNYDDIYLRLLNGRVYELMDRDGDGNCFETNEFGIFEMMRDTWQVLPPTAVIRKRKCHLK